MEWLQNYNPLNNATLSTLVAALPVVILLALIAILEVRIHLAALIGLGIALVIAMAVYGMPGGTAAATAVYGAAYGLFPIGWIILNLIFLYQLTVKKGLFAVLRSSLAGLAPDPRIQVILIAFSFGAFFRRRGWVWHACRGDCGDSDSTRFQTASPLRASLLSRTQLRSHLARWAHPSSRWNESRALTPSLSVPWLAASSLSFRSSYPSGSSRRSPGSGGCLKSGRPRSLLVWPSPFRNFSFRIITARGSLISSPRSARLSRFSCCSNFGDQRESGSSMVLKKTSSGHRLNRPSLSSATRKFSAGKNRCRLGAVGSTQHPCFHLGPA